MIKIIQQVPLTFAHKLCQLLNFRLFRAHFPYMQHALQHTCINHALWHANGGFHLFFLIEACVARAHAAFTTRQPNVELYRFELGWSHAVACL